MSDTNVIECCGARWDGKRLENCPRCGRSFAAPDGSAFEKWITQQDELVDWEVITPTEQMRMAWNAATKAAAFLCKEYAHSGANVYRRHVAYACQRRIEELIETPNVKGQR